MIGGICHCKARMETDRVMPKTVTIVDFENAESKSSVTDILEESIDSNEVLF